MRLAIVNLTGGGLSGGYRKYLDEIVPRLASHPEIDSLATFSPEAAQIAFDDARVTRSSWSSGDVWLALSRVRRQLRRIEPDVVFVPTARWLQVDSAPVVVMVRNMEPLEAPFDGNPFPERIRNWMRAHEARRACERATRVIAVSNHVRDWITSRWRIADDAVGVVPHGVDRPLSPGQFREPVWIGPKPIAPFLFTGGSLRPARGLEDLIHAVADLAADGTSVSAVVAGSAGRRMESHAGKLRELAFARGIADRIAWTGHLSTAEMAWCFAHAAVFVMTSRAEACPNIALEAMSFARCCVSVDHPPMPEFFGETAVYYRAGDTHGLRLALKTLLKGDSGPSERKARGAAAERRAADFTWERTVDGTVAQLTQAIMAGSHVQSARRRR